MYTPITGEITEINQSIVDDPASVNKDPEGASWFFKIKIQNKSELDGLMNKADYEKFAKGKFKLNVKKCSKRFYTKAYRFF